MSRKIRPYLIHVIVEAVRGEVLTTEELLGRVHLVYPTATVEDIIRVGRGDVGLAQDGCWYHRDENVEVAEAVRAGKNTVLADQLLRNR